MRDIAETESRSCREHEQGLLRTYEAIISNTNTNVDSSSIEVFDTLSVSCDWAKTITDSLLLGAGAAATAGWHNGRLGGVSVSLSAELTVERDSTWYSLYGLARYQLHPQADATLQVAESESRLGGAIQRLITQSTMASLAVSARWNSLFDNPSLITKLSVTHRLSGGRGIAYVSLSHLTPMGSTGAAQRCYRWPTIPHQIRSGGDAGGKPSYANQWPTGMKTVYRCRSPRNRLC